MKKLSLCLIALSLGTQLALATAGTKFKAIQVNDLTKLLSTPSEKVAILDANNEKTRKEYGVIPGAKLLSSYNSYDVATTLPADKSTTLVFYCANSKCTASHAAAERAIEAGYTHVDVLSDGIAGWKKSGQKTEQPST